MIRSPQSTLLAVALTLSAVLTVQAQPTIGSCPVLPADNIWNTPVDQSPISGNSSAWVATIGSTKPFHPDFGTIYGIPFITVPGTQTKYPASFLYADQSDPGPYAIPLNAPIEGGSDAHVLSVDRDNCILYELYAASPQTASWNAGSGAIFNLLSNALRPSGWTSADAAGLPIFPGLVRYDEVLSGEIRHAIRFTAPQTQHAFIWPARHQASSLTGAQYPPMGARFRLRASFDITGYSAANQVILKALKKYGMMLADNGSSWYITGALDTRWNDDDLHHLTALLGSDFEAVDVSSLMIDPNSGQAKQSTTVTVTVSPLTAMLPINGTQQFSATVTNAGTQTVNWSVNGIAGGNSSVGWVNSSGFYTAPAVPGTFSVQAASTVSPSAIGTATVTVTAPLPVLSSVSPNSGTQGTSVPVTLTGSNFQAGATVAVSGSGVTVSNVTVVNATQITATFTIGASAATGTRSVTVKTAAGTSGAQSFTVNAPVSVKPTLSSLSPNAAQRGTTVNVTLTGTNFTSPATVAVSTSSILVSNVVVVNSTTITAQFQISKAAQRRSRDVTVSTNAGTSNALSFTIQ